MSKQLNVVQYSLQPSQVSHSKKRRDGYVLQNGMLRSVVTSGSAGKEKSIGNDDDDDNVEWNLRGKEKKTERQRRECS